MASLNPTRDNRDSNANSTTFGKFTVQFKGNLVPTMISQGLLRMLLSTLLHVLQVRTIIIAHTPPPPPP